MDTKKARNSDALKKMVEAKISKAMKEKVFPEVQQKMSDNVQEKVYDVYAPIFYERRAGSGGLKDKNNIVHNIAVSESRVIMSVSNITKGSNGGAWIVPLIEGGAMAGSSYGAFHDKLIRREVMEMYQPPHLKSSFIPYYEPRPFIKPTKEFFKTNKSVLVNSLKKEFRG